jgi:hypothetical protein
MPQGEHWWIAACGGRTFVQPTLGVPAWLCELVFQKYEQEFFYCSANLLQESVI